MLSLSRRPGFDPWVGKVPWRKEWLPTPMFLPGEFHGQRSLVGYSPWSCKESDTTERLTHTHTHTHTVTEQMTDTKVLRIFGSTQNCLLSKWFFFFSVTRGLSKNRFPKAMNNFKLKIHLCRKNYLKQYRHTSEIVWIQFQTIMIKQISQ